MHQNHECTSDTICSQWWSSSSTHPKKKSPGRIGATKAQHIVPKEDCQDTRGPLAISSHASSAVVPLWVGSLCAASRSWFWTRCPATPMGFQDLLGSTKEALNSSNPPPSVSMSDCLFGIDQVFVLNRRESPRHLLDSGRRLHEKLGDVRNRSRNSHIRHEKAWLQRKAMVSYRYQHVAPSGHTCDVVDKPSWLNWKIHLLALAIQKRYNHSNWSSWFPQLTAYFTSHKLVG